MKGKFTYHSSVSKRRFISSLACLATSAGVLLTSQAQSAQASSAEGRTETKPERLKKIQNMLRDKMAACRSESMLDRLANQSVKHKGLFERESAAVLMVGTDSCPGTLIPPGTSYTDSDTTLGANNTVNAVPMSCNGLYTAVAGPDKIYQFALPAVGSRIPTCSLSVDPTGANWDPSIYLLTPTGNGCPAGPSATANNCAVGRDSLGSNGTETISDAQLDLLPAGVYFLFVDSFYASGALSAGTYNLTFNCTTVNVPTAAIVGVGGRITTAEGRGIGNTRVSIVLPSGESRFAITNQFGFYRFDELAVGQAYVVQVHSKTHQFANPSQLVTVNAEVEDLNFVADAVQ